MVVEPSLEDGDRAFQAEDAWLFVDCTLDLNTVCSRLSEGGEAGKVARQGQI